MLSRGEPARAHPRFKKLQWKGADLLGDRKRRDALGWLKSEFDKKYKGRLKPVVGSDSEPSEDEADAPQAPHLKRRKVSVASLMNDSDDEPEREEAVEADDVEVDELETYLALPQINDKSQNAVSEWWVEHAQRFPNVARMARQYLGCPATSATVERLFSQVGIAFSAKRKSGKASTLESMMFARANLP